MVFMPSKKGIAIGVIAIILIAGGLVGGMAYAASQLEAGDLTVTRLYDENDTFKIDFQINMTNPTPIPVRASGASYRLYIEEEFVGTGEVGEINIPSGSALVDITQNIEEVSFTLAIKLGLAIAGDEEISVEIKFTSISVLLIPIPFEYTLTESFKMT